MASSVSESDEPTQKNFSELRKRYADQIELWKSVYREALIDILGLELLPGDPRVHGNVLELGVASLFPEEMFIAEPDNGLPLGKVRPGIKSVVCMDESPSYPNVEGLKVSRPTQLELPKPGEIQLQSRMMTPEVGKAYSGFFDAALMFRVLDLGLILERSLLEALAIAMKPDSYFFCSGEFVTTHPPQHEQWVLEEVVKLRVATLPIPRNNLGCVYRHK